mmetsp:Transcript_6153/g.9572  ORF Transcript_6153/g.9572 Transcript_6153/m.9572 type:complete len:533 (+) Transcript_6153:27-1625(+)|eukprot:CAMPEP_0201552242 /NCGR_PEP_ID=MMETSP0173_2-20130828/14575_1 /ASSEMBLY_ACC=CAM_ASM_000268 /TAXON_ID=218659 /ORGANISM="Vexillifera sp., Strain DIVA3 564/2" /LENGTH=532 /DNA_ID=CAMNT_0047962687 /DNA_START=27 /DNA_END=1625 /DNA_ORIENTATION=+
MSQTIRDCLNAIGVDVSQLQDRASLADEFRLVKNKYLRAILVAHPDRGGDAAKFRKVRTSFQLLREIFERQLVSSFYDELGRTASVGISPKAVFGEQHDADIPPWEFFAAAAEEEQVPYRVELAKSSYSQCVKCLAHNKRASVSADDKRQVEINQNALRIGSVMPDSGTYSRWVHLKCWRVPSRIWKGLPDPDKEKQLEKFASALADMDQVTLCGFNALTNAQQDEVVTHVADKSHWAKLIKRTNTTRVSSTNALTMPGVKVPFAESSTSSSSSQDAQSPSPDSSSSTKVSSNKHVARFKERFSIEPIEPDMLKGHTCVLTGLFPEVGGGGGLNLGKNRLKEMLCSFGARVTNAISGRTTLLVVGQKPGMSKCKQAVNRNVTRTTTGKIKKALESGDMSLLSKGGVLVREFSSGYGLSSGHNGLALRASKSELLEAAGAFSNQDEQKRGKKRAHPDTTKKSPPKRIKQRQESETKVSPKQSPKSTLWHITCDTCGAECSKESWHMASTHSDYCKACKVDGAKKQQYGVDVDG